MAEQWGRASEVNPIPLPTATEEERGDSVKAGKTESCEALHDATAK